MSSITTEDNSMIQCVSGSDPLSDLINGEPVDVAKLELERRKDLFRSLDADFLSRCGSFCCEISGSVRCERGRTDQSESCYRPQTFAVERRNDRVRSAKSNQLMSNR